MEHKHENIQMQQTTQRHLAANARHLAHRNILVHVDSVSLSLHAAFCSVEQLHRGWLWPECSVEELTWRAEQALAPLIGLGILPMITVKHPSLLNASEASQPQRHVPWQHWSGLFRAWLGLPVRVEGFDTLANGLDPFGWRKASAADALQPIVVPSEQPAHRNIQR